MGRVTLDVEMCKKANITKNVTFTGESNYFSITSENPPRYDEFSREWTIYKTAMELVQPRSAALQAQALPPVQPVPAVSAAVTTMPQL